MAAWEESLLALLEGRDRGWDVLEAAVGEGSAVVALGRGQPAKNLAQPVVVVVLREASPGSFSLGQAGI